MYDVPLIFPHQAFAGRGYFRREWIVPTLTKQNWDGHGVVYYDADRRIIYATVQEGTLRDKAFWKVDRYAYVDGSLTEVSALDRHETLAGALESLARDVQRSELEYGPVPEHAWPENADAPWVIFSVGGGNGHK